MNLPICCPHCGARLGDINATIGVTVQVSEYAMEALALKLVDIEWGGQDTRIRTCFANENLDTIGDLVTHTEAELLRTPNFGRISLEMVKAKLAEMKLHLGMRL